MTVPCGLALLFVLPDLPSNTRAFYLSQEEREFALQRAKDLGKVCSVNFSFDHSTS
jgi:MFS transporter, ACS family, pantothenate transporter